MSKKKTTKGKTITIPLTRTKSREEAMNEAVLWVDWDKVRSVIEFLELPWGDDGIPTTTMLKGEAIALIDEMFTEMDKENRENLAHRVFRVGANGISAWMQVIDGEIVELSCGFVIDEYVADMKETNVLTVVD